MGESRRSVGRLSEAGAEKTMIQDEIIVCVSPTSWSDIWRNRQQVMSRFAKQNHIIFVQPHEKNKNDELSTPSNVTLLNAPRPIPFGSRFIPEFLLRWTSRLIVKLNNFLLRRFLQRRLLEFGVVAPILWLYDPLHVRLLGHLDEKLTCWHVHDETSKFPFNQKIAKIIRSCEKCLGRDVDLIFASSKSQYKNRSTCGDKVYYLSNACDFYHFSKSPNAGEIVPNDISHLRRPILGYYGAIHFTIDIELLSFIAKRHPEWSVVLIGPDSFSRYYDLEKLREVHNIHRIGTRSYNVLPKYVKEFDVAIFPYALNSTVYAFPLKLYECLAAGKAIVSTALPELVPLEGLIWIARSSDEFVAKVEGAIKEKDDPERIERGLSLARENDWGHRVEQMSALMEEAMCNREDQR